MAKNDSRWRRDGLETYFGTHPLMAFGSFPISWAFTNMAGGVVAGAAIGAAWNWFTASCRGHNVEARTYRSK